MLDSNVCENLWANVGHLKNIVLHQSFSGLVHCGDRKMPRSLVQFEKFNFLLTCQNVMHIKDEHMLDILEKVSPVWLLFFFLGSHRKSGRDIELIQYFCSFIIKVWVGGNNISKEIKMAFHILHKMEMTQHQNILFTFRRKY